MQWKIIQFRWTQSRLTRHETLANCGIFPAVTLERNTRMYHVLFAALKFTSVLFAISLCVCMCVEIHSPSCRIYAAKTKKKFPSIFCLTLLTGVKMNIPSWNKTKTVPGLEATAGRVGLGHAVLHSSSPKLKFSLIASLTSWSLFQRYRRGFIFL